MVAFVEAEEARGGTVGNRVDEGGRGGDCMPVNLSYSSCCHVASFRDDVWCAYFVPVLAMLACSYVIVLLGNHSCSDLLLHRHQGEQFWYRPYSMKGPGDHHHQHLMDPCMHDAYRWQP